MDAHHQQLGGSAQAQRVGYQQDDRPQHQSQRFQQPPSSSLPPQHFPPYPSTGTSVGSVMASRGGVSVSPPTSPTGVVWPQQPRYQTNSLQRPVRTQVDFTEHTIPPEVVVMKPQPVPNDPSAERAQLKAYKRQVWEHTEDVVRRGYYANRYGVNVDMSPRQEDADAVRVVSHEETARGKTGVLGRMFSTGRWEDTKTEVIAMNADCMDVAVTLVRNKGLNPIIMDAASRDHFGGGYKRGASAQEEELCRRSDLAFMADPSLGLQRNKGMFPLAPRDGIYVPKVQFFRMGSKSQFRTLDVPVTCAVGAVAAHNKPPIDPVTQYMEQRYKDDTQAMIETFFHMAMENQHDAIICVPLGCGAFGNPAAQVAQIFADVLKSPDQNILGSNKVKLIVFAALDDHNARHQYNPDGNFLPFARMVTDSLRGQMDSSGNAVIPKEARLCRSYQHVEYFRECDNPPSSPGALGMFSSQQSGQLVAQTNTGCGGGGDSGNGTESTKPFCSFGAHCRRNDPNHWRSEIHPRVCRNCGRCADTTPRHLATYSHPPNEAAMDAAIAAQGPPVSVASGSAFTTVQQRQQQPPIATVSALGTPQQTPPSHMPPLGQQHHRGPTPAMPMGLSMPYPQQQQQSAQRYTQSSQYQQQPQY